MEKSANQRWKESGSTLTFKEWIDRENKKKDGIENFLPFDSGVDSTNSEEVIKQTLQDIEDKPRDTEDKSKILGLDKTTLVFSSILILGSLTYFFIKKAAKAKK
jgi:hypothetical protein